MCTNSLNYIDPNMVINTSIFDSIRDMATCVFCTGVVINAKQCNKCENCFCNDCLVKWKEKSNDCPFKCGELIICEPSRVIKNILNRISFMCPKNCKKEINYESLIQHITECNNKIVYCPTCNSKVSQDKIDKQSYFEIKIENEILKAKIYQVEKELEKLTRKSKSFSGIDTTNVNDKQFGVLKDKQHDEDVNYGKKLFVNNELEGLNIDRLRESDRIMINIDKLIPPGENASLGLKSNLGKDQYRCGTKLSHNINFEIHDTSVRFSYKFSCCSKYYDCIPCHNSGESHVNSKIVSIACYECLAMTNYVDESNCENCGNSFLKENLVIRNSSKSFRSVDNISNVVKEEKLEDSYMNRSCAKHLEEYGRNHSEKASQALLYEKLQQIPHDHYSDAEINNLFIDEISKFSRSKSKKYAGSKQYKPKKGNVDGNYFYDF